MIKGLSQAGGAVAAAFLALTFLSTSSQADSPSCGEASSGGMFGGTCENRVVAGSTASNESSSREASRSNTPGHRYRRQEFCQEWIVAVGGSEPTRSFVFEGEIPACVEPFEIVDDFCPEGAGPLAPRWESLLLDADPPAYGPWIPLGAYECPEDPLPAAIAQAWRQMAISPQPVEVLPGHGWARATWGVKADLDDSPQTSTVTVLGVSVVLRATPTGQEWSVTDVVAGESWPGVFEVGHHGEEVIMFERREHRVQLGLSTTWEGHYSLNGGSTWISAPGTATTTSEPRSVHVYNPRARLVNCDTAGNCMGGGRSSNSFTLTDPDADGIDNYEVPDDEIGAYLKARSK